MQVVDADMNKDTTCPAGWQTITVPRRLCIGSTTAGCAAAHFLTLGITFEHICGQTKSYKKELLIHLEQLYNLLTKYMFMEYQ